MNYNFTTRQLYPYSDNWELDLHGALWYVWEDDAICLIDGEAKVYLAKGYAAALLANSQQLYTPDFRPIDFYKAYNFELQKSNFPNRYPFQEPHRILHDWLFTLKQLEPIRKDFTGYIDPAQRIQVGLIIRDLFNPCKLVDIKDKLKWKSHFVCELQNHQEMQIILATMPDMKELRTAPAIWIKDLNAPLKTVKLHAQGFIAALINYAIYCYWVNRWQTYNFANLSFLQQFICSWEKREPIPEKANLSDLQFLTDISIIDFCQAYMDAFETITRQIWERTPTIPIECWEGDNFYTHMYACECGSRADFLKTELYQNLTLSQKQTIYGYSLRFAEFFVKRYPVSQQTQYQIMEAMMRDMPPIQLEITHNTEITRTGLIIPKVGNYQDVMQWLEQEKIDGRDHYEEAGRNRTKMCKNISEILGWEVDQNSLQKAQNKPQKK